MQKKKEILLNFFYELCWRRICAQPARCPATQGALGPLLMQKHRFYSIPLCSSRQVRALPSCPSRSSDGRCWALCGRKEELHWKPALLLLSGQLEAGQSAIPIPLALPPRSPFSPAALPCPFVEIYRAEWAENK